MARKRNAVVAVALVALGSLLWWTQGRSCEGADVQSPVAPKAEPGAQSSKLPAVGPSMVPRQLGSQDDVQLTGVVVDEEGRAIAGARVEVQQERQVSGLSALSEKAGPRSWSTRSRDNGTFELGIEMGGRFVLRATAARHCSARVAFERFLPLERDHLRVVLRPAIEVPGIVSDRRGPRAGALVWVEHSRGFECEMPKGTTTTEHGGSFVVLAAVDEPGRVVAYAPNSGAGSALIADGPLRIELAELERLEGIVRNRHGVALEAQVELTDRTGRTLERRSANRQGEFALMTEAGWLVSVTADGYARWRSPSWEGLREIALGSAHVLSGRIVGSETAKVSLFQDGILLSTTSVDETKTFRFEAVDANIVYRVVAESGLLSVDTKARAGQELVLEFPRGGTLSLEFWGSVPTGPIALRLDGPRRVERSMRISGRRWVVGPLPIGAYRGVISADGSAAVGWTADVKASQTTHIELLLERGGRVEGSVEDVARGSGWVELAGPVRRLGVVEDGHFVLDGLPAGTYRLSGGIDGEGALEGQSLELLAGQRLVVTAGFGPD